MTNDDLPVFQGEDVAAVVPDLDGVPVDDDAEAADAQPAHDQPNTLDDDEAEEGQR